MVACGRRTTDRFWASCSTATSCTRVPHPTTDTVSFATSLPYAGEQHDNVCVCVFFGGGDTVVHVCVCERTTVGVSGDGTPVCVRRALC